MYSSFKDKNWGVDLADMKLIRKYNKEIWLLLLCAIDIFSKYAWIVPVNRKKIITISNVFQKILDEPNCKPSIVWVYKGIEFYNRLMEPWLEDNVTEMYSAQNEGKFVVAE